MQHTVSVGELTELVIRALMRHGALPERSLREGIAVSERDRAQLAELLA